MIDERRFEELYRQYYRLVFTWCKSRLGRDEEAHDAAQEVFIRKWQRIETYDPSRAAFKTWLSRNTENLCIDRLRQRRRTPEPVELPEPGTPGHPTVEDGADPMTVLLDECLSRLDPEDRQALLMHEVDGYTWEEMAAFFGTSISKERTRVANTRKALLRCLGQE